MDLFEKGLLIAALLAFGGKALFGQEIINVNLTPQPIPIEFKPDSRIGIGVTTDQTGVWGLNLDVYPNRLVFLGVQFSAKDIINKEELLFTEQIVAGRLGLRVAPWVYAIGTLGNQRYEPPHYDFGNTSVETQKIIDSLPYQDELFYGFGAQVNIPYLVFNKFWITASVLYTNRNTFDLNEAKNFTLDTFTSGDILDKPLTFSAGIVLPLAPQSKNERVENREERKQWRRQKKLARINN